MRKAGQTWNHKRVYRIYKAIGLNIRRQTKKRLPARIQQHLQVPEALNHTWSIDFMSDALGNGRKFRSFHVLDNYNQDVWHIEVDFYLKNYNHNRPHDALGGLAPVEFARKKQH